MIIKIYSKFSEYMFLKVYFIFEGESMSEGGPER